VTALLGVAAEHATARVPIAAAGDSAGAAREALLGTRYEAVEDVVVLDGRRVVGLVPIETLLAAPADATVESIADRDPPIVGPETDQERVAHQMVERAECSIAVVDDAGSFIGLIPPHRMLAVLIAEHDHTLALLGGYRARGRRARVAVEEALGLRIWHRLPWLLVGLGGAMATALAVGAFEEQLERNVLIAFFVPAVVYIAAAVGTQSELVLIRAMSAGVRVRDVVGRELATGTVLGAVVAIVFCAFALVAWGDGEVAVAVGLALVASCFLATVVAIGLPPAIQRAGLDPAFGVGPVATVIQDLATVVVYLAIASSIAA
jgi:magnesium transporter